MKNQEFKRGIEQGADGIEKPSIPDPNRSPCCVSPEYITEILIASRSWKARLAISY